MIDKEMTVRRRTALLATPLVALSLIAAGCGGGGDDNPTSTGGGGGGSAPSSTDAAAILGSIKAGDQTNPAKIGMEMGVTLNGQLSNPQAAAILGNGPISLKLAGPVDPTAKKMDLTFDIKAGKIALPGKLRLLGETTGYVGLQDKWYELPAGALESNGATADPQKAFEALGNPADLLSNATVVGGENIDGIDTDHISGDINVEGVVNAVAKASASQGDAPSDAEKAEVVAKAKEILKSGKADVWVGKDDKQVHRLTISADVVMPAEQKAQLGVDGAKITFTVQSTPTGAVTVEAPAGALPSSQLQSDLGAIVLSSLGAGTTTTP